MQSISSPTGRPDIMGNMVLYYLILNIQLSVSHNVFHIPSASVVVYDPSL